MEEERFFRAAVEDEGVAPLEPGDEMSLARFFASSMEIAS